MHSNLRVFALILSLIFTYPVCTCTKWTSEIVILTFLTFFLATDLFNTKQSPTLLRWLTAHTTKSSSKLEFSCWPSQGRSFLVGIRGHSTSSVGVSVSFPSCESYRLLSPHTFGPWPDSFRMDVVQNGRHNLRGQMGVFTEILDNLVDKRSEERRVGKECRL